MTVAEIMAEVARLGVTLRVDGTDLVHRGPRGALGPQLAAELKRHKSDVIAELIRNLDDSPAPSDLIERCAILEFDGRLSRQAADQAAAQEFGFPSLSDAHAAMLARWRSQVRRWPTGSYSNERLKHTALEFLNTPCCGRAILNDWSELELWAVHIADPLVRTQDMGLVPDLARKHFGSKVIEITATEAVLHTPSGAILRWRRRGPPHGAIVFWKCSRLLSGVRSSPWH